MTDQGEAVLVDWRKVAESLTTVHASGGPVKLGSFSTAPVMRTRSVLGALGQRRLAEMALENGCAVIDVGAMFWAEPGMATGIDWGSKDGTAYVHSVDSGRYVIRLADAKPPDLALLRAKVERFIAKARESHELDVTRQFLATRAAGKNKMLASSYAGQHNEGAFWVDATGSHPFYGPWLPHPEPEVFYQ